MNTFPDGYENWTEEEWDAFEEWEHCRELAEIAEFEEEFEE